MDLQGLVVRNTGSRYDVRTPDGQTLACTLANALRLRHTRTTNPVAIGDNVTLSLLGGDAEAAIIDVAPRRNYIIRRSTNLSKEAHILAANIDRALLLANLNHPPTTTIFIDRFLVTATAYRIPVLLAFNKADRYTPAERDEALRLAALYTAIGYPARLLSVSGGEGFSELAAELADGLTLLSGHSGAGKTSLINRLVPGANLPVGDFSERHHRGTHTTTAYRAVPYLSGAYLIDSPGVKGFATLDISPRELTLYFPDIFRFASGCRFDNCTHRDEPHCAVLDALRDGRLHPSRYKSYLNILADTLHPGRYRPPH
jgi:ribosome biogenesis GTPase